MGKYLTKSDHRSIRRWIKQIAGKEEGLLFSEDYILAALRLPYECIGIGKHRIVFDLDNGYVLKVAREPKGIRCNRAEATLYQSSPPHLRKYLCKIAASGHGWLVMKKVDRPLRKRSTYAAKVAGILEKFHAHGIHISDIISKKSGRPKKGNIRLTKNKRLVFIDYANVYPIKKTVP